MITETCIGIFVAVGAVVTAAAFATIVVALYIKKNFGG